MASEPSFLSSHRWLIAIVLCALAVRILFLVKDWDNIDFVASYGVHAEVARNILEGRWYQIDPAHLTSYVERCQTEHRNLDLIDMAPPEVENLVPLYYDEGGYGVLLAGLWKLTGIHRWWPIRVLQVLVDVLMVVLVFGIGRSAGGQRAGLAAAALFAVFVPQVEMAVRPHRDVWVSFLFISSVFALVVWRKDRRSFAGPAWIAGAGAVVTLMRSTALLFAPFVAFVLLVVEPLKRSWKTACVMLAVFSVGVIPLIVRNTAVFGTPMATRGAVWHSFWGGVGQFPNRFGLKEDDASIIQFAQRLEPTAMLGTLEYEQVLKREGMRYITSEPLDYASRVLRRAFTIMFPKAGRALFFQQPVRPPTGFINNLGSSVLPVLVDVVLGCLAIAGIVTSRIEWRTKLLISIPFIYTVLTLSPFVVQGRNIANMYFVVLVWASVAVARLWELGLHRRKG